MGEVDTIKSDVVMSAAGDFQSRAVAVYCAQGLAVLDGFFEPSCVADMAGEADRLHDCLRHGALDMERVAYRPTMDNAKTFERIDPVCDLSDVFSRVARDQRVLDLVAASLGDNPILLKDKLIYKFPGDSGYGLHQDYPYFGFAENNFDAVMNVAVPIDPISLENGGLRFYLGCHRSLQPAPSDRPRDVDPGVLKEAATFNATVAAGTLLLFHSLTPHESGPNHTQHSRRVLFLTFIQNRHAGLREHYYSHRASDPDIHR
nr:MAG: hypothetical protein E4H34_04410 [Hyphomicrobiales bacterium]